MVDQHVLILILEKSAIDVLNILMSQGGSVRSIVKQLGLEKYEVQIRRSIKQRGIDVEYYRYMNRRYGNWLVLPGRARPCGISDRELLCRCMNCGHETYVLYSNLTSNRSKGCRKCAESFSKPVCIQETEQEFRSIRSALISLDALNQYQAARHKLNDDGEFTVGQYTIKLK